MHFCQGSVGLDIVSVWVKEVNAVGRHWRGVVEIVKVRAAREAMPTFKIQRDVSVNRVQVNTLGWIGKNELGCLVQNGWTVLMLVMGNCNLITCGFAGWFCFLLSVSGAAWCMSFDPWLSFCLFRVSVFLWSFYYHEVVPSYYSFFNIPWLSSFSLSTVPQIWFFRSLH